MKLNGAKIQNEIMRREMTMIEFAKRANLPPSTLYRVINGGRSTTRTTGRLARALDVPPQDLLEGGELFDRQ